MCEIFLFIEIIFIGILLSFIPTSLIFSMNIFAEPSRLALLHYLTLSLHYQFLGQTKLPLNVLQ